MPETTGPEGTSLTEAGSRIAALFSAPAEDKTPATTQPEQPPKKETAQQAPPAPAEAESEAAKPDTQDDAPDATPAPRTLKVKLPDGEQELPEDEVVKGYLRNSDYTRKQQALAEDRRKFETEEAQNIRAVRSEYGQTLDKVKDILVALNPAEPNWAQRANEVTPEQLKAEVVQWQTAQKAITQLMQERAKVTEQEQADAARGFQQYVELEKAKLEEAIPEFRDSEKRAALQTTLRDFAAKQYGFSADDFNAVTDSRLVRLLHDANQYHAQKAKVPDARNKIESAPEVSGPGAARSGSPKSDAAKLREKAQSTGRVDDAGAAIGALLTNAQRRTA